MNRINLKYKIEKLIAKYLSKNIKKKIKESFFYRVYDRSSWNWRYPIFALGWQIANFLTKPRNVSIDGIKFTVPCENWITHFRWYDFKIKKTKLGIL